MSITKDKVVQFNYILKDTSGEQLETTYDDEPVTYLHGHDNVLAGLEEALEGKNAGDKFDVTLPPEKAYGVPAEDSIKRISKKYLKHAGRYKVGDTVPVKSDNGVHLVTVKKVGHSMVDIDTNHPFAGKTLTFELEVLDVRDAEPEEIEHGHVHGPGGHHH
ncbi:peptidylprolyl isomerase [Hahella sp. CCB-MM4]|uniref:FKBP-type peptidyl-prolyl cis-trans isomerase n=1 Tax=Hahella sp. (strain CCB-MM4) TaxID=1926491 RepID=UPI000B9BDEA2|nr:peptidylprolyl isomerase [Hahella sp. CCB-MM4]OZG71182.1 peptidylprolyl isomerase [Hahella sp. CCB-MM4]